MRNGYEWAPPQWGYFGTHRDRRSWVGRHRAPTHRFRAVAVLALGVALGTSVPAPDLVHNRAVLTARSGEGVIAITTRACGTPANWRAVAAANGIKGPAFLVRLGQRLTVSCGPATVATPTRSGWTHPAPGAKAWSCWGAGRGHKGIDLSVRHGAPVRAAAAGKVTRAGWVWSGYGISVTINHGAYTTHYAHLSSESVRVGQSVARGQQIGRVGQTGYATGPHLHFEVATRPGVLGAQINPAPFLRARGVRIGC